MNINQETKMCQRMSRKELSVLLRNVKQLFGGLRWRVVLRRGAVVRPMVSGPGARSANRWDNRIGQEQARIECRVSCSHRHRNTCTARHHTTTAAARIASPYRFHVVLIAPPIICIVRTVIESLSTSLCVKATIAAL